MNLFSLLETASKRLKQNDPDFHRQTETTTAILRSSGVLPIKRASVNGAIHSLLSAAIVQAYDNNTTVDITSRSVGKFHYYGFSTKLIGYLDRAVQSKLLISKTNKAKVALELGDILETYLAS
ncbi:hypothetical protein N9O40_00895 [Planktomarina sp.]|nr:hypothetical protein [Planktomarina sp.]